MPTSASRPAHNASALSPCLHCRGGDTPLKVDAWILPRGGSAETTFLASNRSITASPHTWFDRVPCAGASKLLKAGTHLARDMRGTLVNARLCPSQPLRPLTHSISHFPLQYTPKYGSVVVLLVDSHVTQGVNEAVSAGQQVLGAAS